MLYHVVVDWFTFRWWISLYWRMLQNMLHRMINKLKTIIFNFLIFDIKSIVITAPLFFFGKLVHIRKVTFYTAAPSQLIRRFSSNKKPIFGSLTSVVKGKKVYMYICIGICGQSQYFVDGIEAFVCRWKPIFAQREREVCLFTHVVQAVPSLTLLLQYVEMTCVLYE